MVTLRNETLSVAGAPKAPAYLFGLALGLA